MNDKTRKFVDREQKTTYKCFPIVSLNTFVLITCVWWPLYRWDEPFRQFFFQIYYMSMNLKRTQFRTKSCIIKTNFNCGDTNDCKCCIVFNTQSMRIKHELIFCVCACVCVFLFLLLICLCGCRHCRWRRLFHANTETRRKFYQTYVI